MRTAPLEHVVRASHPYLQLPLVLPLVSLPSTQLPPDQGSQLIQLILLPHVLLHLLGNSWCTTYTARPVPVVGVCVGIYTSGLVRGEAYVWAEFSLHIR